MAECPLRASIRSRSIKRIRDRALHPRRNLLANSSDTTRGERRAPQPDCRFFRARRPRKDHRVTQRNRTKRRGLCDRRRGGAAWGKDPGLRVDGHPRAILNFELKENMVSGSRDEDEMKVRSKERLVFSGLSETVFFSSERRCGGEGDWVQVQPCKPRRRRSWR